MGLKLDYIPGQTPLDEDEKEGLLIRTISTRGELDEFEQANIEDALEWTMAGHFAADTILTEEFVMRVHKKMFGKVWNWAGTKRRSNKNIGVDKVQIGVELKKLLDDCNFWLSHKTYNHDEIAVRFSHRLVSIHVFPNGNGRHSRLIADILVSHGFGMPVFSWGGRNLSAETDLRKRYLEALYRADAGDIVPLLRFARS